jgi:glycosyltransferase involved in cell wall biosynthesis
MALTVIQILPALESGGVERGTVEIARHLVHCGHRSIVVSAGGRMVPDLIRSGSEHRELPIGGKSPWSLRHVPLLRKIFSGADIVHARSRFPAWLAWLAWRGMDPRHRPGFVTTVHGAYSVNFYSGIMCRGEMVIAVSDFIRGYILRNYPGTDPDRVRTIQRGIDPEHYHPGFRPDPAWSQRWQQEYPGLNGKFLITLPGRITRRKGHEHFLKILARLRGRTPDFHGLCVGGHGPDKQRYARELRQTAAALGLERDITFTGARDDLREILSISGVVVSLSELPEAFGRTVLEALALGTPVVAWDHGGVSEILQRMLPGGLVPPGDIAAAAGLIGEFQRERPVIAARHPFQLQSMLDGTIAVYEQLAGLRPRS